MGRATQGWVRALAACVAAGAAASALAQPVNDSCSSASPVPPSGGTVLGTVVGATSEGVYAGCGTSTTTSLGKDVWYAWTPDAAGPWELSLCTTSPSFDTVLSLHTACPVAGSNALVAGTCADDTCGVLSRIGSFTAAAGAPYLIRVSTYSGTTSVPSNGGAFTLTVQNLAVSGGACCSGSSCTVQLPANCTAAGAFRGVGTACTPNPCGGACCNPASGSCSTTTASGCASGSTFLGLGTVCTPNPCGQGACCSVTSGSCTLSTAAGCAAGNAFQGAGTSCSPNACPQPPGPPNVACPPPATPDYTFTGTGFTVSGNNQPTPATLDGSYAVQGGQGAGCSTSNTSGTPASYRALYYAFTPSVSNVYNLTMCATAVSFDTVLSVHAGCPATGVNTLRCNDDGTCGVLSSISGISLDAGVTYIIRVARYGTSGEGGPFTLQVTSDPVGACCRTDGTCATLTQAGCGAAAGALYQGDGSTCSTAVCTGACCNAATGGCTSTGSANCGSGSTFQGVGVACSTNPCPQPPPPANDGCSSAPAIGVGSINGSLNGATPDGAATCGGTSPGKDVYYSFTAPATGYYNVSTCSSATSFDTVLSVHSGCPATTTNSVFNGCADQGCPSGNQSNIAAVPLTGGVAYLVRVAYYSSSSALGDGAFTLSIAQVVAGACCSATGTTCTTTLGAAACSGVYQGDGSLCTPNPCGGACCNPASGSCSTTTAPGCASGSTFLGLGTVCTPNPCGQGACCTLLSGACTLSTAAGCASPNTFQGAATVCSPSPCALPPPPANDECAGALTVNVGANPRNNYGATTGAQVTEASQCGTTLTGASGGLDVWYRFVPAQSGDYAVDTCSSVVYDTVLSVHAGCPSDTSLTLACNDDAPDGTECPASGALSKIPSIALTAGQTYYIRVGRYGTAPTASDTSAFTINITPNFGGTGVCCRGSACEVGVTDCSTTGTRAGAVVAAGAGCNATGNTDAPCCKADYNKQGNVELLDIFDFLQDWFAGVPFTNHNGDANASGDLLDIFSFLEDWFQGPCA